MLYRRNGPNNGRASSLYPHWKPGYCYKFTLYYSLSCNPLGNIKRILFCGDQLTVERARGSQEARINSNTEEEALLGLEPAVAD